MLYLYRRVVFGAQKNADAAAMPDLSVREWGMLAAIAIPTLWMGVYPETFIAPFRADIATLDARLASAKPASDSGLTKSGAQVALAGRTTAEGSAH